MFRSRLISAGSGSWSRSTARFMRRATGIFDTSGSRTRKSRTRRDRRAFREDQYARIAAAGDVSWFAVRCAVGAFRQWAQAGAPATPVFCEGNAYAPNTGTHGEEGSGAHHRGHGALSSERGDSGQHNGGASDEDATEQGPLRAFAAMSSPDRHHYPAGLLPQPMGHARWQGDSV